MRCIPVVTAGPILRPRPAWLWLLCLVGAGTAAAQQPVPAARVLWERGQAAMSRGHAEQAIRLYGQSLELDPAFARNHLSLAAAYLEKGDAARACDHMGQYLEANPAHLVVRAHYAELLLRLDRAEQARAEFERCAADAQEQGGDQARQLIHCHSRLMELAEAAEDGYAEHLHRGIGLFLLACDRGRGGTTDDATAEGLLCRAAAELTLARAERPDEARPCWYLYEVWSRLAQRRAALRCLHDAAEAAPFSYLTPAEQIRLALARGRHDEAPLK
ncbi:MAG TPA: tetratricopeptide repeat protein [Gemmataceae bacterium]|nr:tetratricopeptide repeat protein [Gemmataceae bacterium]